MLARVRNRRGIITGVDAFDGHDGRYHMVNVEYTDTEGVPAETLLWERENGTSLLEPTAMPRVSDRPPMRADDFDALVRSARWSALTPFLDPATGGVLEQPPVASPFHGAVQVEDFQLVPLLKALRMPRVSLMLADDVGLGKTIEAGLVLSELLLRRRIRRVLVLTPASLRDQWQQEMDEKFSLSFDVVDRRETHQLQRRLGLDANPWRTFPRIITSYHYLKQPDVLEQFRSTFGGRVSYGYLYDALDVFFREGGSEAWVSRVVGPNPVTATSAEPASARHSATASPSSIRVPMASPVAPAEADAPSAE